MLTMKILYLRKRPLSGEHPPATRVAGGIQAEGKHSGRCSSKLVAQGRLDLPGAVYDGGGACKVAVARKAEVVIPNIPVHLAEDVSVEGIGNIQLKHDRVRFANRCSFDDGEVLVEIGRTSPGGDYLWQISVNVPAPGSKGSRCGIKKTRTIHNRVACGVGWWVCTLNERSRAWTTGATAVPSAVQGGRPVCGVVDE